MQVPVAFEKISTNKSKVKGLGQAFSRKACGCPEGRAIWSSSAEDEIRLRAVKMIKSLADKYKSPKAACTKNAKSSRVKVPSQINPKLFHAGGLKPRDIPSGMAILVSAVRRRYGQTNVSI